MASPLCFDSGKRPISRESIMVLNGAMDKEELALMPVDSFETAYEAGGCPLPAFVFGDDDDYDDEDDFDDDEDDYEDDDDYDDDELEDEDDDDDEDDDYDDDEEDDDYEEDDEDWDDFDE